jgi:hypothetical protein
MAFMKKLLIDHGGKKTLGDFYLNRAGAVKGGRGKGKVRLKEVIDRC